MLNVMRKIYDKIRWRFEFFFLIIKMRLKGEYLYDIVAKDIWIEVDGQPEKVFDGWLMKRGYFDYLSSKEVNHTQNAAGAIASLVVAFELMDKYYSIMAGNDWRYNWNPKIPYVYRRDNKYSVTYLHIERVSMLEALSMPLIKWMRILPSNVIPSTKEVSC